MNRVIKWRITYISTRHSREKRAVLQLNKQNRCILNSYHPDIWVLPDTTIAKLATNQTDTGKQIFCRKRLFYIPKTRKVFISNNSSTDTFKLFLLTRLTEVGLHTGHGPWYRNHL